MFFILLVTICRILFFSVNLYNIDMSKKGLKIYNPKYPELHNELCDKIVQTQGQMII